MIKDLINDLDNIITNIIKYPKMNGSNNETLEFRILDILLIKDICINKTKMSDSRILIQYQKELQILYPNTNQYLHSLSKNDEEFIFNLKKLIVKINTFIEKNNIQTSIS